MCWCPPNPTLPPTLLWKLNGFRWFTEVIHSPIWQVTIHGSVTEWHAWISLTSITCKMPEHIITSNIMQHLYTHHILHDAQHGLRKHRSTETQLIQLIDNLAHIDNRIQTDAILLDFQKTFAKVPHQRLLYKLPYYGISPQALNWVQSFLSIRRQRSIHLPSTKEETKSNWNAGENGPAQKSTGSRHEYDLEHKERHPWGKTKKTRACIDMAKKAAEQMFTKASSSSLHVPTDAVWTYTSWRWCNASMPDTPATTSAAPVASLLCSSRSVAILCMNEEPNPVWRCNFASPTIL